MIQDLFQINSESEVPPTLVSSEATRAGHNSLHNVHTLVQKTIFTPCFIEYPETSTEGVLYVIDIRTLDDEDVKAPWNTVRNRFRTDLESIQN